MKFNYFIPAMLLLGAASAKRRLRGEDGDDHNDYKAKEKAHRKLPTNSKPEIDCAPYGSGKKHTFALEWKSDRYPEETTWVLNFDDLPGSNPWFKGYDFQDANFVHKHSLNICEGCYTFVFADSYGDGVCCSYGNGYFKGLVDNKEVFRGGAFAFEDEHKFCVGKPSGGCNERIEIDVVPDNYPGETTWELKDSLGSVVEDGTTGREVVMGCSGECYEFTIFDTFGDGICCDSGKGSYTVRVGGRVIKQGGQFVREETTPFCV